MRDKTILITGGTGSFGKAMTKELLTKNIRQIRVYSRDELKQAQMAADLNDSRVEYLLGDVRDFERLKTAMQGVDIVIHAAAMKRIEACEHDPQEAVKTNVQGSINVANACLANNVSNAILVSTDKACYPINCYGSSKLLAEKVWINSNVYRGLQRSTKFSVVRYGNVFGSRGSVIHAFKESARQGVIKVTDSGMTRFFITLQQAIDLVQLAIEFQQGGEIFVPKLKAASIYHLAELMAGKALIEITNQRGGEKLHESLVTKEEKERMVSYEHYSIINPELTSWPYRKWTSEFRDFAGDSSEAPHYSDKELRNLLQATA